MSTPFLGEIKLFAGNFAPVGYHICDGSLLAISQNDALFALLGTMFGGDGIQTFALPDLRGRVPVHMGTGAGLSTRIIGQVGGEENHTLLTAEMPAHSHTTPATRASSQPATETDPAGRVFAVPTDGGLTYGATASVSLGGTATASNGGGQAHNNLQPYACVNMIIALEGIFPSRN
ncbi:MAG: tail fiber protein [Verrucomicrobia bacterium]|nr:tail fiber protein [Verrucomicrobiota bacterium]